MPQGTKNYSRKDVFGTHETGFKTIEDWATKLGIKPAAVIRRIRTHGVVPDTFRAQGRKTTRGKLVTDPFTGIKMTMAEHSRRLGVCPSVMESRIRRCGMMNPKTWKHGSIINRKFPIWEREKHMKLRKNPFTGQVGYDYEWAELLDMTPGSFRDRAQVFGWNHKFTWSHNRTPMPERRVRTYCGKKGEGAA